MKLYLQRVWALSASLVGQNDSSIQISCWTTVANEIYQFFGSKRPLCASAFLSWLLWDSFCFVRVPASLGTSPLLCFFVLYCPGFSGTAFGCLVSLLLWVPPQPLCASAFLSRLLWDSFSRVLAYLGPFPFFLEMHGLGDFDAPLDSVALISLFECISRALAAAASRLLWELLFC